MELDRRRQFLQMCDVIHDGPAFDRMTLGVDEVKVDLGEIKKELHSETLSTPANEC